MAKASKEEQRKAPILRFKGFTDDWEQRKLGDLITEYKKVTTLSSGYSLATSSRRGLFLQKDYFNGLKSGVNDKQLYKILPPNFITYRYMSDDLIFHFNKNSFNKNLLISKEYPVFQSISSKCQNDFLISVLNNKNIFSKFAIKFKKGGTRTRLYLKTLKNFELKLPSIDEQSKIKNIISILEKLLTLYERKLKLIKLIYKELENKVYNNDLIKQTSFIKVKLREILQEKNIKSTYENQYPILSSTNSGIELRNGRTNSSSNIGYKILSKNELVLSPQNLWLGNININFNFENGLVSPSYRIFKLSKNINPIFLNSLLHHPKMMYLYKVVSVQGASVVRRNLDIEAFEKLSLQLPAVKIQNKIGSLLNKVQKLTDNLENKRKQLIKIKNMLLNTMFI